MIRSIGKYPYLILIVEFIVVYAASLTFLYIEGDDAATIAYHALGRNVAFEEPYSPYHGMMDTLLNVFPANESLLRVIAIGLAAISALTYVIYMLKLIQRWLPSNFDKSFLMFIPLLPIMIPEFFFFGLLYTPSTLAMTIIFLGHLMVRDSFSKGDVHFLTLIASALLFGFGVSFRWDVGVYGIVIFADILLIIWRDKNWDFKLIALLATWCVIGISALFLFIYLSGYSPPKIFEVLQWAKDYVGAKSFNPAKMVTLMLSYITPASLIFAFIGIVAIVKSKKYELIVLVIIGFLPKLYIGLSVLPKGLVMAFPGFVLLAALGFDYIRKLSFPDTDMGKYQNIAIKVTLLLALMIPWMVGIQLEGLSSAWGPGFEKTYKYTEESGEDVSMKNASPKLALAGGFAVPTPEGPRPVWGYTWVLLAGEWRQLVTAQSEGIDEVIQIARNEQLPILQNNEYKLVLVKLLENGFQEKNPVFVHQLFKIRTFKKGEEEIDIIIYKKATLFNRDALNEATEITGEQKYATWFLESGEVSKLKKSYPNSVKILGPSSAILDLSARKNGN